jgi:hypothetical protein
MKRILFTIVLLACFNLSHAQKEGRLGVYSGLYVSYLMNANDFQWGDYLPTYKVCAGIEGSYFVTVGKKMGVGLSGHIGRWNNGQNYKGAYKDGSEYEAFSRLKYTRAGMALNFSTNIRRKVTARVFAGANVGFLDSYQERYEHLRVGNQKLIIDVNDQDVYYRDQYDEYGTLTSPIYEPLSISTFYGLGFDVKITDDFVFSLSGRFDMGMGQIEKEFDREDPNTIVIGGENARIQDYPAFPTAIKFHGPTKKELVRQPTTNQTIGVFVGFSYRFYNRDRTDIWYVR